LSIFVNAVKRFIDFYNTTGISIPSLKLLDLVDIGIVAFVIYVLIAFIKETRGWSLLKGIGIIAVVGIFAMFFQLNTIAWIIKNALSMGIIAIIIVFQPEMRTALERLGRKFSTEISDDDKNVTKETANEIFEACIEMAKVKTGALIVLENKVGLREYSKTGIDIDANIKCALIMNIFEHNTPLHDGAVIIKNNRILSATCYLPLTESEEISKKLGTRHRAAIGLSEVTDALIIVVSEETGKISLVKDGKIDEIKDRYTYRQLENEKDKKDEFIRRIMFNNFEEKESKNHFWERGKKSK